MSILNFNKLLAPVTEEDPCGEDLTDLTEYYILEEYARGKEETQFSEAEPPDWKQVEKLASELLFQGKEMWVVFYLVCSITANHGISGLNEGIRFLSDMLSSFWENIYPETDFDDTNPYEQRMNILSSLSDITSPLVDNIKKTTICRSRQIGEFSLRDIQVARGEINVAEGENIPEINLIEAAVRDTDSEFIEDMIHLLKDTIEQIRKIDDFLNESAGQANNTSNILKIEEILQSILDFIEPYSGGQVPDVKTEEAETEDDSEDSGEKGDPLIDKKIPGVLNSRDDAYALLGEMIQWYELNEPASPVAMILGRAKSLVGKNFFQIVSHIMGPEVPQIQALFGAPGNYPVVDSSPEDKEANFGIRSRNDILNWLDKLAAWYAGAEPSSPVPLLIHRAKQLVGKNFEQIINEIANQAQGQVADLLKNK